MPNNENCFSPAPRRTPWNKGKLIGAKPPLRPKHVWSIRTRLLVEGRTRDLAMFNLAIDSKLRGCDVVALKVDDVAPICAACLRMDRLHRTRSQALWHPFAATDEGNADLPAHWQLASRATL